MRKLELRECRRIASIPLTLAKNKINLKLIDLKLIPPRLYQDYSRFPSFEMEDLIIKNDSEVSML